MEGMGRELREGGGMLSMLMVCLAFLEYGTNISLANQKQELLRVRRYHIRISISSLDQAISEQRWMPRGDI